MLDKIEVDANRALAINAVNRRLSAVGRVNWGIVDVSALDVIVGALGQVVNERVEVAYGEASNVDAALQEPSLVLERAAQTLQGVPYREAAE